MTTTTTRRAIILAGAAALPAFAAPAAIASIVPDPIIAAIEHHKAINSKFLSACEAEAPDEISDPLCEDDHTALQELLAITPLSLAGCAAFLRWIELHARETYSARALLDGVNHVPDAEHMLSRIAAVIEGSAVQS